MAQKAHRPKTDPTPAPAPADAAGVNVGPAGGPSASQEAHVGPISVAAVLAAPAPFRRRRRWVMERYNPAAAHVWARTGLWKGAIVEAGSDIPSDIPGPKARRLFSSGLIQRKVPAAGA